MVSDEIDSDEGGPRLLDMPTVINQTVLLNKNLSHLSSDEKLFMKNLLQKFNDIINDVPGCSHEFTTPGATTWRL